VSLAIYLRDVVERININTEYGNFQVVESLLSRVINEFERRISSQNELVYSLLPPDLQFLICY
jgi:Txe/YoeB family toxin of Txe-Axe toxin-antitoxin module